MTLTGLLVISNVKQLPQTLKSIEKYVHCIYIHLNVPTVKVSPPSWSRLISQMYMKSAEVYSGNQKINVKILVGPLKADCKLNDQKLKAIDMIFSDGNYPEICEALRHHLHIERPTIYLGTNNLNTLGEYQQCEPVEQLKMYDHVVLGGTFDRIHLGHKIFLTEAVLRACYRLVVGVTSSKMTKSKTLSELILPVNQRIKELVEFLQEIDPSLQYEVVPIDDPYGPTKSDPNMNMIVVSEETYRGAEKVNELRLKNNLQSLDIHCIKLVEFGGERKVNEPKEAKISSTNRRMELLGTRLRSPKPRSHLKGNPYIIGLTGGIASGKSTMSTRLQSMGAITIDCDKIAHEIYEPGAVCYQQIVETFGKQILHSNGKIDRSKLGPLVFQDALKLEKLNSIVWPELRLEVKKRIDNLQIQSNERQIVVMEAAVLLKAGWDEDVHEVWSMIIPPEEAIRRIMERDHTNEKSARDKLSVQMSNVDIVARSHVVFSSLWQPEFTAQQAEKAWKMLMNELNSTSQ